MSETGNSDKTATAAPAKVTLHLKRPVEQGTVRQSFSHGRSKAVVVEKVKRRILTPAEAAAAARPAPAAPAAAPPPVAQAPAKPVLAGAARAAPVAPARPTTPPPPKTGVVLPTLSAEQREARARALIDARAQEEEDRRRQGSGRRSSPPARGARPRRTRSRGSAQARRGATPRPGKPISGASQRTKRDGALPAANPLSLRRFPASLRPAPAPSPPGTLARAPAAPGGEAEEGPRGRR